jgi:DNA mismatch repair protein MutL
MKDMVQKIVRLPIEVINKIAAGEVVENPASIVKELIENSLDAGAKQIDIAIEKGGCAALQIEDDGCGMGPEDAILSLERHATSKIRTEADLQQLATMGFRGEALAAISSVSKFCMKTSNGEVGTHIEVEGAKCEILPCARNPGTTVIVRDLFFNVPARKKFLKSPSANTAALVRMVESLALAHPEIGFSLKVDGKIALQAFPEERRKRIETLLQPMPLEAASACVWGLLAAPEEAKVNRKGQHVFVNRRAVFSPLIARAVKMGYGTRIESQAYPSFVLFLDLSSELVDVNVHPQKKEVRIVDEGKVFRMVERAVAAAFEKGAPSFARTLSFPQVPFSFAAEEAPTPPRFEQSPLGLSQAITERPLAVVEGYFFLQAEELLLIDLAAARARVLYESLKEKKEPAQSLLWPIEIEVEEEGIVEELENLGIECRWMGKKTLVIDALPSLLDPEDFPLFLRAWQEGKKLEFAARRYATLSKKRWSIEEAYLLWRQLLKCPDTLYDPGGRRIWDKIDAARLRKILEGV